MTDRELELREPYRHATDEIDELAALIDAIDLASDQDTATWITRGGKRVARIVPVDDIPPGIATWAGQAGISATEFMALPAGKRRELLDQFYRRLHGEQS